MKIHHNKYIDALLKTMLFSASIHMIILIVQAIRTGDIMIINYFNILDLEIYYPHILKIPQTHLIAASVALIIYLTFLIRRK